MGDRELTKTQGEGQWYSRLDGNCNRNWGSTCYLPLRAWSISFFFTISLLFSASLLRSILETDWLCVTLFIHHFCSLIISTCLSRLLYLALNLLHDLTDWDLPQHRQCWLSFSFSSLSFFPITVLREERLAQLSFSNPDHWLQNGRAFLGSDGFHQSK